MSATISDRPTKAMISLSPSLPVLQCFRLVYCPSKLFFLSCENHIPLNASFSFAKVKAVFNLMLHCFEIIKLFFSVKQK